MSSESCHANHMVARVIEAASLHTPSSERRRGPFLVALLEKAALELYSGTRGLSTVRGSNPKMGKRNVSVDCRQSADAACTGQAVRRSSPKSDRDLEVGTVSTHAA